MDERPERDGESASERRTLVGATRVAPATIVIAAALVAAAVGIRVWAAASADLWFDEIGRLRCSTLTWRELWTDLPYLQTMKSPYLIGLHKLWTLAVGTGASIVALRAYPMLMGMIVLALIAAIAHAVAGRRAAWTAFALTAFSPYFVRWSVDLGNYGPAAIAVLGAWWLALSRPRHDARSAAALGAIAGAVLALFPLGTTALVPLVLFPSIRAVRPRRAWLAALALAAIVAAPALVELVRSAELHAPAYAAGRAWSAYVNPRKTPFEVLARIAGEPVRAGQFEAALAVWFLVAVAAAALCIALAPAGPGADELRVRRAVLFAGALFPFAAAVVVSKLARGILGDRYAYAFAGLLPAAAASVLHVPQVPRGGMRSVLREVACVALWVILAVPLADGVARAVSRRGEFPEPMTTRAFNGTRLVDDAIGGGAAPPETLAVHGEMLFCHAWLRSRHAEVLRPRLRHLTTRPWIDALRAHDVSEITVPPAWGWPFCVARIAGPDAETDRETLAARVRAGARVWLLVENPRITRTYQFEEDEERSGLDAAYRLLAEPRTPERTAGVLAAVRRCMDVPDGVAISIDESERAALVRIGGN